MWGKACEHLLLFRELGSIAGYENTIHAGARYSVHGIAIINMLGLIRDQLNSLPVIQTNGELPSSTNLLHGSEVAGTDVRVPVRCCKSDALAYSKIALFLTVDRALSVCFRRSAGL